MEYHLSSITGHFSHEEPPSQAFGRQQPHCLWTMTRERPCPEPRRGGLPKWLIHRAREDGCLLLGLGWFVTQQSTASAALSKAGQPAIGLPPASEILLLLTMWDMKCKLGRKRPFWKSSTEIHGKLRQLRKFDVVTTIRWLTSSPGERKSSVSKPANS